MTKPNAHLLGGRLLAGNTVWNLLGQFLPMVAAVFTIPPLVRGLGVDRFGLLSLAWIAIGYFSLFDFGIGRALTKEVADRLGAGDENAIPSLVWTSLALMLVLGLLGTITVAVLAPWLVGIESKIPPALRPETLHSLYLLALSIPLVTLTAGFRGVLEAKQRFRILNVIRVPMSIFLLAGPLLVLPFSHSLAAVIGVLVAGRVLGLIAHQIACFRAVPGLSGSLHLQRSLVAPLLHVGGWMTVSNIVGPLVLYLDRFLIGSLLSMSMVAYYTVPFDVVSRLMVVPAAITGVLFPAFALSMAHDPERTALLLRRGTKYTFIIVFPVMLVLVTLAPEILRLWMGPVFAVNSGPVLRWLAAGVFMNCLATVPFALLQGIGRPDVTGKILLLDLPISSTAVWLMVTHFGIQGAAVTWMVRATLEAVVFLALSRHFLSSRAFSYRRLSVLMFASVCAFYLATLPSGLAFKIAFLILALLLFVLAGWFLLLGPEERFFLAKGRFRAEASSPLLAGPSPDAVGYQAMNIESSKSERGERR